MSDQHETLSISSGSEASSSLTSLVSSLEDMVIEKRCFYRDLWQLASKNFRFHGKLTSIRGKISDEEDTCMYYEQFVPHIMEELRATIAQEMECIENGKATKFKIAMTSKSYHSGEYVDFKGRIATKELPERFNCEAVMLHVKTGTDTTITKVFAIASPDSRVQSQDMPKLTAVTLKVHSQDASILQGRSEVAAYWLAGLIPSQRMYYACAESEFSVIGEQFTRCELLQWPVLSDDVLAPFTNSKLNDRQQLVVDQLVNAKEGMYLLQGPPGTGKSTVAVELLNRLVMEKPQERILMSAPSNKAIQVVLANIREKHGSITVALLGKPKELSDKCEEVYVDGYVNRLVAPLVAQRKLVKDALKESDNGQSALPTEQWSAKAFTTSISSMQRIHDTLTRLLQEETLQQPIFEVKRAMQKLLLLLNKCLVMIRMATPAASTLPLLREKLNEYMGAINSARESITSFLVQRASIVFATLVASGRRSLQKQIFQFDTVIVDEAAQALVPALMIPLKYTPNIYIQMGDPCQLPATVISNRCEQLGYGHSMMHWLMLEHQQPHQILTTQYRMVDDICQWPSQHYYESQLVTDSSVSRRARVNLNHIPSSWKHMPSLFINVNGEENRHGHSISNATEAKAVVDVALRLVVRNRVRAENIGIITFYAGQVDAIKEKLNRHAQLRSISVSTVDGFQGDEKLITLVSVVRTSRSIGFVKNVQRLNVALTRARDIRWIFGYIPSLEASGTDLATLVHAHRDKNQIRTIAEFLEQDR